MSQFDNSSFIVSLLWFILFFFRFSFVFVVIYLRVWTFLTHIAKRKILKNSNWSFYILASIWLGCTFTLLTTDLKSLILPVKAGIFIFLVGSVSAYWSWLKWSYDTLKEMKIQQSLSFFDQLFFWLTSLIRALFLALCLKVGRALLLFCFVISYLDIAFFLFLVLVLILVLLLILKQTYEYKIRDMQMSAITIGLYGSFCFLMSETTMFSGHKILCTVVFITAALQFVFLFVLDLYYANINKETLWWRLQFVNMPDYVERFYSDIQPFVDIKELFTLVNPNKFQIKVLLDWFCFGGLSFYSISAHVFPVNMVTNTFLLYGVLCGVNGNFVPLIFYFGPLIGFTFLCSNAKFQGYVQEKYGPTVLKSLHWNTGKKTLLKQGAVPILHVAGIICGVAVIHEADYQLERYGYKCRKKELQQLNAESFDIYNQAVQRGITNVKIPEVRFPDSPPRRKALADTLIGFGKAAGAVITPIFGESQEDSNSSKGTRPK